MGRPRAAMSGLRRPMATRGKRWVDKGLCTIGRQRAVNDFDDEDCPWVAAIGGPSTRGWSTAVTKYCTLPSVFVAS